MSASFDQTAWDDATTAVRNAYSNEGYIYAQVRPVVERSDARFDVRW